MQWLPKPPEDTRLYSYDLSDLAPDKLNTTTFVVTSGTVTLTPVTPDDRTAYVLVSGGANGETDTITLTATTLNAQTIVRTITLKITSGADDLSANSTITKGEIFVRALGELGIAHYVFDTEAEEDVDALKKLDMLAARWQGKLKPFGYLQPTTNGASLPTDLAGIEEQDVAAFVYGLAEISAPSYGKTVPPTLAKMVADSRSEFFVRYAVMPEYALTRRTPTGAGNDRWSHRRFFWG